MDTQKICEHLRPLLEALASKGMSIERPEAGWTNAELVVVLNKELQPNIAEAEAKARGVVFWRNDDAHYSIEFGFFCNEHKHSVSWPQSEAVMTSI